MAIQLVNACFPIVMAVTFSCDIIVCKLLKFFFFSFGLMVASPPGEKQIKSCNLEESYDEACFCD